jgi:hypothetical protein
VRREISVGLWVLPLGRWGEAVVFELGAVGMVEAEGAKHGARAGGGEGKSECVGEGVDAGRAGRVSAGGGKGGALRTAKVVVQGRGEPFVHLGGVGCVVVVAGGGGAVGRWAVELKKRAAVRAHLRAGEGMGIGVAARAGEADAVVDAVGTATRGAGFDAEVACRQLTTRARHVGG